MTTYRAQPVTIAVILPMPPSANNLFVNARGRGRVKSDRYAAWIEEAGWELKRQIPGFPTITGPVSVDMVIGKARGDLDNRCKPILDLLTKMRVWEDDRQVIEIHMRRGSGAGVVVGVLETQTEQVPA